MMLPLVPLAISPLTRESFAPFGDVIEPGDKVRHFTINAGNTERYHDLANLSTDPEGHLITSIFRGLPRHMPLAITMMERHPLGSQLFMPLNARPYLVVVARPGPVPAITDLRCFLAQGTQGVNYGVGVWHHPLLALGATSDFLIIDRSGPGNNCDEIQLNPGGEIVIDLTD